VYALLLHRTTKAPLTGIIGYDTTATFCWVEKAPSAAKLREWVRTYEQYGILPLADLEEMKEHFTIVKMKAEFKRYPPGPRLKDILRPKS